MSYDIFISYSTKDLEIVQHVQRALAVPGVRVFIAEYSVAPGAPLAAQIENAIRQCNLFLLLWSRNSRASEWVPQEIGVARGCGREIFPIVVHADLKLPGFIEGLKYAKLYEGPDAFLASLRQHAQGQVLALEKAQQRSRTFAFAAIAGLLLLASGDDEKDDGRAKRR